jgi:hypothetical protein
MLQRATYDRRSKGQKIKPAMALLEHKRAVAMRALR